MDKVIKNFCIINEFDKIIELELKKNILPVTDGKRHRNRKVSLSDSEIMTILLVFHSGVKSRINKSSYICLLYDRLISF